MQCPRCNGSGRLPAKVLENGRPTGTIEHWECPTCRAKGTVDSVDLELYKQYKASFGIMWCKCRAVNIRLIYHDNTKTGKPFYTCATCGKRVKKKMARKIEEDYWLGRHKHYPQHAMPPKRRHGHGGYGSPVHIPGGNIP